MANEHERQTPGPGPTGGEPRDQIRAQDQQGGQAGTTTTEGGFVSGNQQPGEQRSFAEGDPGGAPGRSERQEAEGHRQQGGGLGSNFAEREGAATGGQSGAFTGGQTGGGSTSQTHSQGGLGGQSHDSQGGQHTGQTMGGQGQREAESYRDREDLGQQNLGGGSATGQGSPGQDFDDRGDGQGEVEADAEDVRPDRGDRRQ